MSAGDIQAVGLPNLAKFISESNGFLTSVREYRGSDFGGLCCSNIFTSQEAGSATTDSCKEELMAVIQARAAVTITAEQIDKMMLDSDENNDGLINYEEFVLIMTK